MKYFEQVNTDFDLLTELGEADQSSMGPQTVAKAFFYKGKVLKKMENQNDAILNFEQVIKLCDDSLL